jgi:toxin YoeB
VPKTKHEAVFQSRFLDDIAYWVNTDRKTALRVLELVHAVLQDPFVGIGKPELLRFGLAGFWSRRITQEHRLVYEVSKTQIRFHQARYHY